MSVEAWVGVCTLVGTALGVLAGFFRSTIVKPLRRIEAKTDRFGQELHEEFAPTLRGLRADVTRIGAEGKLAHKRIDHLAGQHNDLRVWAASVTGRSDVSGGNPLLRSGSFRLDSEDKPR